MHLLLLKKLALMKRLLLLSLLPIFLFTCEANEAALGDTGATGQGGSLARFTIVGDFLYTLEPNSLKWYRIESGGTLQAAGTKFVPDGKETIFPLGDLLFIGANDGMSIFQINAEGAPEFQSEVSHIVACDPVVANDEFAYVTLRTESCRGLFGGNETENLLNIYDVNDINNPNIIASYDMISPRGMGLADDILFVCEGPFGLRTLNVSDPLDVEFVAFKEDIHANDVIVLSDILLVIGPDNITQFDYSDPANLVQLSEIRIE